MNLARTNGYKTIANATTKLKAEMLRVTGKALGEADIHHLIAVNDKGRFVPVVLPIHAKDRMRTADFASVGITVLG